MSGFLFTLINEYKYFILTKNNYEQNSHHSINFRYKKSLNSLGFFI